MNAPDELSLRDFYNILYRRKREIALWWSVVFSAVAIYTAFLKPQYRTQVLLRLQMPDEMTRSIQIDVGNIVSSQNNPFNVEALLSPESLHECLMRIGEIVPGMPDHEIALKVSQLSQRVTVKAKENDSQLVTLSVIGNSADRITREANTLSNVIVDIVSQQMAAKTHQAKTFIESQLREVSQRLHDSEDKLRHYQERFGPQSAANFLLER